MASVSLFSKVFIISLATANGDFPGLFGFPGEGFSRTSSYSSSSVAVRGADGTLHTESRELRDEGINDGSGPRHARAAVACKDLLCKGRLQRKTPQEGVVNSHVMTFRGLGGGLAPKNAEFDSGVRIPYMMDLPLRPHPSISMNMGLGMDVDDMHMGMGREAETAALTSPFAEARRIAHNLDNMGQMIRNVAEADKSSDALSESVSSSYAYTKKGREEAEAMQITRCKDGACETKAFKTPQEKAAKPDVEKTAKEEALQKDAGKAKAEELEEARD